MRTQGHTQAMISARHGVAAAASPGNAESWTAASPSDARSLRRTFRGETGQVPLVRDFVSTYLDARRCPAEAVQDTLVCATELVANAVLHSRSGLPGGYFSVEVACTGQWVRETVEDSGGPWAERGDADIDAECGRGLHIVSALSADMGTIGDDADRMVWFCSRSGTWFIGSLHAGESCSGNG